MNGHYYSLNEYLLETFGEKVYKLSIDLGLSCPNRDGSLDTRGCIFCNNGSSHFAQAGTDISKQIELAKSQVAAKTKAQKFIAYFQSYTNTYAPCDYLEYVFTTAISRDDIVALSIATRPDCISDDVLQLLERLNKIKPVWIELGLQTSNEKTADYIRRCYPNSTYKEAVKRLKDIGIYVITHIILGLPGENTKDMLSTVDFAVNCKTDGIKLQLLHILKDTDLYTDYMNKGFHILTLNEYIDILCACLEIVPSNIVIHRITGDPPKSLLVEPKWSADKKNVLNTINRELNLKNVQQGNKTSTNE